MLLKFKHPFSLVICGPSQAGKSSFTCRLLENLANAVDKKINKVLWCYGEKNSRPSFPNQHLMQNTNVKFHAGVPDSFENESTEPILVILDDLMCETGGANSVAELFTKGSHHRNISVILITQNIFHKGARSRDISLNAQYLVLFKNPRDLQQISFLARQIYPQNSSELSRIYKEATVLPHSYLLIDLTQATNDLLRFRTDIFNPHACICYCNTKCLQTLKNNNDNENESSKDDAFGGEPIYFIRSEVAE